MSLLWSELRAVQSSLSPVRASSFPRISNVAYPNHTGFLLSKWRGLDSNQRPWFQV